MNTSLSNHDVLDIASLRDIYQTVFMIQKILFVHQETSLPVFEKDIENSFPFDSAMITGILQAISSIGQEMIGIPTGFKQLRFHGFVVTGSYCEGFTIYIFSETELVKEVEEGMKDLVRWFSKTFTSKRVNWDGLMDIFRINRTIIESKISQHLFLWLLYPFQTTKNQNLNVDKLSDLGKIIFECINKDLKCTSAKLLDYLKQYEEEKVLFEIFNLVFDGYIETSIND